MDKTMIIIIAGFIWFFGFIGMMALSQHQLREVCESNNMLKDDVFDNTFFGWDGVVCKYLDDGVWKYVRFDKTGKRIPEGD